MNKKITVLALMLVAVMLMVPVMAVSAKNSVEKHALIVITVKNPDHKPVPFPAVIALRIHPPDFVHETDYVWEGRIDENSQLVIQNDGTFKAKETYLVAVQDFGVIGTFKVNNQGGAHKTVYSDRELV